MDPDLRPDPRIHRLVTAAAERLEAGLDADLPGLSTPVRAWLAGLSPTIKLEDYFLHPQAYPLVQLPFWLLETVGAPADDGFAADLAYAALSGYCWLRLLDNLMDGQETNEREILPAANYFQLGAWQPFAAHFEHGHAFWSRYRSWWLRFAEATWQDASRAEIDREAFERHAADKTCPEKILIAAAAYRAGRADVLERWADFAGLFGRWHQMGDDLRDWAADFKAGRTTYFLSEAARRTVDPGMVPAWVAREGYRWGVAALGELFEAAREAAAGLACPPLDAYLQARAQLAEEWHGRMLDGFRSLSNLTAQVKIAMMGQITSELEEESS